MLTVPQFYIEQGIPKARWMFPGRCYKARLLTLPRTNDEGLMYIQVQDAEQAIAYQDEAMQHEMGSYALQDFEKIKELSVSTVPVQPKKFLARVVKPLHYYVVGDEYVISEPRVDGYYHVYLKNRPENAPIGSYLTNFFEIIAPYDTELKTMRKKNDSPKNELEMILVVNELPEIKEGATVNVDAKAHHVEMIREGQMNLFEYAYLQEQEAKRGENNMLEQALTKIKQEMVANEKQPYIQVIGQLLTNFITANPAEAEKVMADKKTIKDSLNAMRKEAEKHKVGNCAVLTDEQGFKIVLDYFGIKSTGTAPIAKQTTSVTQNDALKADISAPAPVPKPKFTASLDEFL